MFDVKVSLPTAAVLVIAGIIISGYTETWLWSYGLFGFAVSVILFTAKLNRFGLVVLLVSLTFLLIAATLYSGWLSQ